VRALDEERRGGSEFCIPQSVQLRAGETGVELQVKGTLKYYVSFSRTCISTLRRISTLHCNA
jgi:hypothetical protein